MSEIKKLSVFVIGVLHEKHLFFAFGYVTADDIINMPAVIPSLTVRIDISVVVYYPSVLIFPKDKCRFIKEISAIKD
ncbi:MAG: hypothetical protein IKN17_03205 [Ruminococcus sp.]|nr:hypothetical protein [Ruminococcus sp.]